MENLVPLSRDPLLEDHYLDIIRGLERIIRVDKDIAVGESFSEGDWAVLNNNQELEAPGVTPVANTYPVWAGNAEGRSDVHATGKATIIMASKFIYRTEKFNTALSYNVGDLLTVKDLGDGERVPTKAGGSDPVLAKVVAISDSIMEIEVI